jgi:hypothetical protein
LIRRVGDIILFASRLKNGIINMAAVTTDRNELASRQQVIKAFDELKAAVHGVFNLKVKKK